MKRSGLIKRKTRLKPASDKRRKEMATYKVLRECFLRSNPLDAAWLMLDGYNKDQIDALQKTAIITLRETGYLPELWATANEPMILKSLPLKCPHSNEVHHAARRGKNYLNVDSWIAVSRPTHLWIESHAMEARRSGLLSY